MLASVRHLLRSTSLGLRGDLGRYQGETPFAIWLAERVLEDSSWCDEETGSSEWRHYIARIGRRVVTVGDPGFVEMTRFDDEAHACAWFDAEREDFEAQYDYDEDADDA